jgi:polysaccharide export outer membrane protein
MLVRLSLVSACALSLLLGACAHDPNPMAVAGPVPASHPGERSTARHLVASGYPVPVSASNAGMVAWGPATVSPSYDADPPYRLDTGDRLRIFVYGQPNLSRLYIVDQQGKIAVPLIGSVTARGKTTNQLQAAIRSRLGAEFVKDPQVTVDILQNRPFFILGEVKNSGQFPYVSGMTVETAVAIAGGYTERASERSFRITRREHGAVEQFEVPGNFPLKPGDTVYVFERFF